MFWTRNGPKAAMEATDAFISAGARRIAARWGIVSTAAAKRSASLS
jgi:hypothetical protein